MNSRKMLGALAAGALMLVAAPEVRAEGCNRTCAPSPGRACKVAWKKGDVIGIKFV